MHFSVGDIDLFNAQCLVVAKVPARKGHFNHHINITQVPGAVNQISRLIISNKLFKKLHQKKKYLSVKLAFTLALLAWISVFRNYSSTRVEELKAIISLIIQLALIHINLYWQIIIFHSKAQQNPYRVRARKLKFHKEYLQILFAIFVMEETQERKSVTCW